MFLVNDNGAFLQLLQIIHLMHVLCSAVAQRLKTSCTGVTFFVGNREVLFKTSDAKLLLAIAIVAFCCCSLTGMIEFPQTKIYS